MHSKLRLAYFAHSLRSDWNNGNAHFLRGLLRALGGLGHQVNAFEPESEWSIDNLQTEPAGQKSLQRFAQTYADIDLQTYSPLDPEELWRDRLRGVDVVLLHEWNPPLMARTLLHLREQLGYKLLFHDTHHRASSSPEQIERFSLRGFDGIVAFGSALATIYRQRFHVRHVWTLHEAADTTVFRPNSECESEETIVWIGNWGDGERSRELCEYLLQPAAALRPLAQTVIYGVRYPKEALASLGQAGVRYGGYLANLDAPEVYARSRVTVHVPRQQYAAAMTGIPTIRVFEALACGIPLASAPWQDTEQLFRPGDFLLAQDGTRMTEALRYLLSNPSAAEDLAARGRETVLARHTCRHRAQELTAICEEVLR
jgi:spore maturation protein CgeB